MKKAILLVVCIILFVIGFNLKYKTKISEKRLEVQKINAEIDELYIYGRKLNIKGSIEPGFTSFKDIKLVLYNNDFTYYDLKYHINGQNIDFLVSEEINNGILLDDIKRGNYYIFIEISTEEDGKLEKKYYPLINKTEYKETKYFTISKQNNKITILNEESYPTMKMVVEENKEKDIYDIVIDPGHGGDDPGATASNYYESKINLNNALKLKKALEDTGLRVILTRSEDVNVDAYGTGSRTGIPHEVWAKYFISLHVNSTEGIMDYGGVEVYAPNNSNLNFASLLAKNIVESANTNYSYKQSFKAGKGVYVRTFTSSDINESISEAREYGFSPYDITTDTNYYFTIRETGGYMTGAYVDGRYKYYAKNDYYNSNVGVESYILELGYINYPKDLNNLIDNSDGYITGIVNAFKEELNIYGNS